jgi:hypothetical protein
VDDEGGLTGKTEIGFEDIFKDPDFNFESAVEDDFESQRTYVTETMSDGSMDRRNPYKHRWTKHMGNDVIDERAPTYDDRRITLCEATDMIEVNTAERVAFSHGSGTKTVLPRS